MPNERSDKIAMHFLEEEIKVKARELADYYEQEVIRFALHINKSKKDVKLHTELIDTK